MSDKKLIGKEYKVLSTIGKGSFATIYKVQNIKTSKKYALKYEKIDEDLRSNECLIYSDLAKNEGIPKIFGLGFEENYRFIVLELLGKNLHQLFEDHRRQFSKGCIANIAIQCLKRIEDMHSMGVIHCDLKPNNIMVGSIKNNTHDLLYLVDFGLSYYFLNPIGKTHIEYTEVSKIVGNLRFSSYNNHRGILQTRRDDLEAWFYIILYLFKGKLPWDEACKHKIQQEICRLKICTSFNKLCSGCPKVFTEIISYIRNLHFYEKPDYNYLRKKILTMTESSIIRFRFDWVKNPGVQQRRKRLRSKSCDYNSKGVKIENKVFQNSSNCFSGETCDLGNIKTSNSGLEYIDKDETIKGILPEFKYKGR